ncbi:uncharacterized protein LOC132790295 [Drosophila nasuta]|uniref:uncharacterized protein LOC132790295 n=1 Tax=Drosophila nasuta TaxID=42062 RepID=UPI00295EFAE2|nr:uncharacterized protein LOC132790295 [Drosophila nasuta]
MSGFINCAAYTALAHEGWASFLKILNMVNFAKSMQLEVQALVVLFGYMIKLLCFIILAYGVITHNILFIRIWLLMSYTLIDLTSICKCFAKLFEYFFTNKYPDKSEFILEIRDTYCPLMGEVMARIGIILTIYRYYQSLQPPVKIRGPITFTEPLRIAK